ncbi:MAG: molybdenum cofactor biosynthesis protein MoaE [Gemmatimonadota bacterium]
MAGSQSQAGAGQETGAPGAAPERARPAALAAVQAGPIDMDELRRRVAGPAFGAVATFAGTVRDSFEGRRVRFLEYEAYGPMAEEVMREIAAELRQSFEIGEIAIAHRTGRLEVGETSVGIAVSAPHRRAALAACAEAIERVKARLPVWKKEHFDGGEVWRANESRPGAPPERP